MVVKLVEKYGDIIQSWAITEFDSDGPNQRSKAKVTFIDDSILFNRLVILDESKIII